MFFYALCCFYPSAKEVMPRRSYFRSGLCSCVQNIYERILMIFSRKEAFVLGTRVVSSEISGNFLRNFSGNFRKNNGTFPE